MVLTQRVGSVEVLEAPTSLQVGERATLVAVARNASGDPLQDKEVYWGSRDTTIVSVDSITGIARARVPGVTQIVASSEDQHVLIDIVVPPGPAIAFDALLSDELSAADDVDEFRFAGAEGQLLNILLQGTSNSSAHQFQLGVFGPAGNALDSVTSRGNDTVIRGQAVKWLRLPQSGMYRIRIEGRLNGEKGTYQLMIESINPAPETASDAVMLGAAVTTERLSPGDIDDFTFAGTKGQEISLLLQAQSGTPADSLRLRLVAPGGGELVSVQTHGDQPFAQSSGRLQLAYSGVYTLRVQGLDAQDQGPYEIQVVTINRNPEQASVAVLENSIVREEALAPPGDVDEFLFTVTAQQEVNVYLQGLTGAQSDSVILRMLGPTGTVLRTVTSAGNAGSLQGQAISHLRLSAATYSIQVEGGRNTRGPYQFVVRPINLAPENASAVVLPFVLVSSEDISPVGDVDQFRFSAMAGDAVQLRFQATGGVLSDVLHLYVYLPSGDFHAFLQTAGNQTAQRSTTLPQTGEYLIRIAGANSSYSSGPYQFQIIPDRWPGLPPP